MIKYFLGTFAHPLQQFTKFKSLAIVFEGKRIGFPKIGAGLARGDWAIIEEIIENNLEGMCDYTLVEYRK